jgi:glycerol-3-phosphate dehydrogenase
MDAPKIVVIGGGAVGSFITHDLAARGLSVTLVERANILGGTSAKFHGMLHSGARYAVNDVKEAREVVKDNRVISNIAPHCIEDTRGIFLGLDNDDLDYASKFTVGCKQAGIDVKELDLKQLRESEPFITKETKVAFGVPDKVINSFRLVTSLMLTAKSEGAEILLGREAVGFETDKKHVAGVKIKDSSGVSTLKSDLVINASGPWIGRLMGEHLGINSIDMIMSAGTMVVMGRRFTKSIVNRLRSPSDGDIVVPYFTESIIGTTAFIIEDPDNFEIDRDDVDFLVEEGSKMIPAIKKSEVKRYYAGVRALISPSSDDNEARNVSRDFKIFDHETTDGISGIATIGGGKLSTSRLMAKNIGDFVCGKFGIKERSKTDSIDLVWPKLEESNIEDISKKTGISSQVLKEVIFETSSKTYSDMYSPAMDIVYSRMLFD